MFNKKLENLEYQEATKYLKQVIIELAEDNDGALNDIAQTKINSKLSEIDSHINRLLEESFVRYCRKKNLSIDAVLFPLGIPDNYNPNETYDYANLFTTKDRPYHDTIYKSEYHDLLTWQHNKLKFMDKHNAQLYISLEGASSIIRGLDVALNYEDHILSLHPMDSL